MRNFAHPRILEGLAGWEGLAFEAESRKSYYIFLGLQTAFYLTVLLKGLTIDHSILSNFLNLLVIWMCGFAFQYVKYHRIGQVLKAIALFTATLMTIGLLCGVLAISDRPYADAALNALDKAIFGIDWVSTVKWVNDSKYIALSLNYAYVSLNWQPVLLFFVLFWTKKDKIAWKSLAVLSISVAICIVIFPIVPAVGGYAYFDIPRQAVPNILVGAAWDATTLHDLLRTGAIHQIGPDSMGGLITMPSFHAAASIILGWGFWHSPMLRWPLIIINFLMLLSAVPIGGHYIVDVLAGSAIALLAIGWVIRSSLAAGNHPQIKLGYA